MSEPTHVSDALLDVFQGISKQAARNLKGARACIDAIRKEKTMSTEKTKLSITIGQELFRFETFQEWVNKAPSWYATSGLRGCPTCGDVRHAVAVDAAGRICRNGAQFMRARDDGSFPVVVYLFDPDQSLPSSDGASIRREIKRRLGQS